jgi:uncharacterized LabA/DUF88 family protein
MALNIFPRREAKAAPATEPEPTLPEPSVQVIEDAEARKRPTRRGSRGGRGRARGAGELLAAEAEALEPVATETVVAAPKRPSRSKTALAARALIEPEAAPEPAPAAAAAAAAAEEPSSEPAHPTRAPSRSRRGARPATGSNGTEPSTMMPADASTAAIVRAIEAQGRQIEQLTRLQEELLRRPGGGSGGTSSAPPARVGIFVDAANIELACDRLRARFDWKKILNILTLDRQLVRAIAYSPVHDDPGVSIETQRFVEPFLGGGFKVVTKPLKRFADGSIKANVDIELALDVVEMLDRLDIVVLASGDGDFVRLVEVVQSKGVRVEVVAVGSSTASNLKHAADQFIDLQTRLREIRA